jgi:DNA-binding response OmpR family regulator
VTAAGPAREERSLRILVVDDEPAMVGVLGALLGRAGHRIVPAYDGEDALRRFRAETIDLVLLDLSMPGMDGADVCRAIRAERRTPIIVVTGERDRDSVVDLLELGADDYVRKPFRSDELLARIGAVVRRASVDQPPADPAGWTMDAARHEIRWRGTVVPATMTEYRLLARLVTRLDQVVTHEELLQAGWPDVPDADPLWLKPHLARLRDKLARTGAPQPWSVRGVGYRLSQPR